MQTKQIMFTAPYVAELLDVEYLPPKANELYNRLASEKNFQIGVLFDWRNIK